MIYFLSDLHLGHTNIISHCKRPFSSVEEMDRVLIENWNGKVGKNDTVYIVGDMIWDKRRVGDYLPKLSGHKILIRGNHDAGWVKKPEYSGFFDEICPMLFLKLCGHPITLCHYPLLEWEWSRKPDPGKRGYLIYGHIHNNIEPLYRPLFESDFALNAGADINGFTPVTFEELAENNRSFRAHALERLEKEKKGENGHAES
ncbi:MAG: metallophosphoesterase [Eubacteriales bacterium]